MRAPVVSLRRRVVCVLWVASLVVGLALMGRGVALAVSSPAPAAMATGFDQRGAQGSGSAVPSHGSRSLMPAMTALASGPARIGADAPLDAAAECAPYESTVESSGFRFAAMLGEEGPSAVLVGTEHAMGDAEVPAEVAFGDEALPVSRITAGAVKGDFISSLFLPETLVRVDDGAFACAPYLESIQVAEGNPSYSSYDGMLFDAARKSLLLIPEGKQGPVLLPKTTESAPPRALSHCAQVTSIAVEEGGAAFSSWNGCLYDLDGTTLVRVPPGLGNEVEVLPSCTRVAAGALEGCDALASIVGLPDEVRIVDGDDEASVASSHEMLGRLMARAKEPSSAGGVGRGDGATGLARLLSLAAGNALEEAVAPLTALWAWGGQGVLNEDAEAAASLRHGLGDDRSGEDALAVATDGRASFLAADACSVAFDGNGGTGGQAGTPVKARLGEPLPAIDGESPSRAGFAFKGWYDGSDWERANAFYGHDGSAALDSFPFEGRELRLYAGWNPIVAVTVPLVVDLAVGTDGTVSQADSYRFESASGAQVVPFSVACSDEGLEDALDVPSSASLTLSALGCDPIAVKVGETCEDRALLSALAIPARSCLMIDYGMELGGAQVLVGGGSGAQGRARLTYGMELGEGWPPPSRMTVALDANGASDPIEPSLEATYGLPLPPLGQGCLPERLGYELKGWFDGPNGKGADRWYEADGSSTRIWTETSASVLYAGWEPRSFTVAFDANGGSGGQSASVRAVYDSPMPEISHAQPVRTGHTFKGWYDGTSFAAPGARQYYTAEGASARSWDRVTDATLYAGWAKIAYAITWKANGGSWSGSSDDKRTSVGHGEPTTGPTSPTRSGYTFKGWATSATGTVAALPTSTTRPATYYAVWALNSYALSWHPNGGNWAGSTAPKTTKAEHGAAIVPYATAPVRAGYLFKGWADSPEATAPLASFGSATKAKTFYAVWGRPSPTGSTSDPLYIDNTNASWAPTGIYGLADIKAAANDLSAHGSAPTGSGYYEMYKAFLDNRATFKLKVGAAWYDVEILGICQDTRSAGGRAGLTFAFKGSYMTKLFNENNTPCNSAWEGSWAQRYLQGDFFRLLDERVQSPITGICPVEKAQQDVGGSLQESHDQTVFLPSVYEVLGRTETSYNPAETLESSFQYQLFIQDKTAAKRAAKWWTRTPNVKGGNYYTCFIENGGLNSQPSWGTSGYVPAFAL